jgi:ketosteroid isomerase-like protein
VIARDAYVELVEEHYFGNVSRGDIEAVVRCFRPDAQVVIYHGDAAPRRYRVGATGPGEPIRDWYRHLVGSFEPRFTEFEHYVDVAAERVASTFLVTLTPRARAAAPEHGVQRLRNCNFFRCANGKIASMIVYYANPLAPGSAPTGYPRA